MKPPPNGMWVWLWRPDPIVFLRPSWLWFRSLGVTKVQMGAQSLDNRILELNQRIGSAEETLEAMHMLRASGFKVVLHWMPNLLGATPQSDREDFVRLWHGYCPDEIKIYPNQLLENSDLYDYWPCRVHPYTTGELVDLIADIKVTILTLTAANRIVCDIPSTNVVEGITHQLARCPPGVG